MKGLIFLLLLYSMSIFAHAPEQPPACISRNFNYSGPFYNDSYSMPKKGGLHSCQDRKTIDAVKLGKLHKTNRELISKQIEKMLSNISCKDIHEDLTKYNEKIKEQKDKTQQSFKVVVSWFEFIKSKLDIQRQWAYAALYNSACSFEKNSDTIFIDLDTINTILRPSIVADPSVVKTERNKEIAALCKGLNERFPTEIKSVPEFLKKATGTDFLLEFQDNKVFLLAQATGPSYECLPPFSTCGEVELLVRRTINNHFFVDKRVFVGQSYSCDRKKEEGTTCWELQVFCWPEDELTCVQPKNELAELLKKEINYYKEFLNANATERHCLEFFDKNILKAMEEYGLFIIEGETLENTSVPNEIKTAKQVAVTPIGPQAKLLVPATTAISTNDEVSCNARPNKRESIFKLISWNYCMIGREKLGLE